MKTVHFHIGPHKTGSTAIQKMMRDHSGPLEELHGITAVKSPAVDQIARSFKEGDESAAAAGLKELANICQSLSGDCLISSEDFSGELPGRSQKRKPYPRLFDNMNAIRKAFRNTHCKFYFFVRAPNEWLRSSYAQILKHPSRFSSLDEYKSFLRTSDLWDETLRKTREKQILDFTEIPYIEDSDFSSVTALLYAILGQDQPLQIPLGTRRPNASLSTTVLQFFEMINRSGASADAQKIAKQWLSTGETVPLTDANELRVPNWPVDTKKPDWLSPKLEPLWTRANSRIDRQEQPNLLPDPFCDLSEYRMRPVEAPEEFPEGGRAEMQNQVHILRYRFRGQPETCYLLGLAISYLRRNTDHSEHAAYLFQRLWHEEYAVLLGMLPTRWLISTFQTFLDHGGNESQRKIGAAAYFLSNILKAYEAERALDGLAPDSVYPSPTPTTKSGFTGMDRFKLGGTDLLLNTNALLLELASQDDRAGRVVQEFLLRTKAANSIFSRMDQSRIEHDIDIPQFANCWSFFDDPRGNQSKK